jgi:hypothetical protein
MRKLNLITYNSITANFLVLFKYDIIVEVLKIYRLYIANLSLLLRFYYLL